MAIFLAYFREQEQETEKNLRLLVTELYSLHNHRNLNNPLILLIPLIILKTCQVLHFTFLTAMTLSPNDAQILSHTINKKLCHKGT